MPDIRCLRRAVVLLSLSTTFLPSLALSQPAFPALRQSPFAQAARSLPPAPRHLPKSTYGRRPRRRRRLPLHPLSWPTAEPIMSRPMALMPMLAARTRPSRPSPRGPVCFRPVIRWSSPAARTSTNPLANTPASPCPAAPRGVRQSLLPLHRARRSSCRAPALSSPRVLPCRM